MGSYKTEKGGWHRGGDGSYLCPHCGHPNRFTYDVMKPTYKPGRPRLCHKCGYDVDIPRRLPDVVQTSLLSMKETE